MELDTFRAVNPRHLQIFRVDREWIIDDIIMHELIWAKNTRWFRLSRIFVQNAWKRCCWHCNIWPIILLLILKLHTGVCEEMFNVNIKIVQTTQNIWNFIVGKSSLQEMANFRLLSGRFHTLIWRPGDTVQNLESLGLSGRFDSTAHFNLKTVYNNFSSKKKTCWDFYSENFVSDP